MKTVLLFFLFSIAACAGIPSSPLPALENRKLLISKEVPGLYYQWEECTKKGIFGACREKHLITEQYDLRDAETVKKLRDMGFSATSERKIKP